MTSLSYTPDFANPRRARAPRSPWPMTLAVLIPLAIILAIVAAFDSMAAGIGYAVAVVGISFWRPQVALMMSFALSPFVKELPIPGPVSISIGEFTLALCLPAFIITSLSRIRFPAFLFCTLLYLGACIFTTIANMDKQAVSPFVQMVLYLVVAVLVFSSFLRDPSKFTFILDGALGVSTFLALLSFTPFIETFGLHKNSLGASMASALLIAVECWLAASGNRKRRRRLMVIMCILAVALLISVSRGAWIAAFMGVLVIISLRRQFKLALQLAAILTPIVLVAFFALPEEKQEYASSFDPTRVNIGARIYVIEEAYGKFKEHPIYGAGIHYRKDIDATNVVFISLAESGIVGFAMFALMHAAVLRFVWKTQKNIPRFHMLYSPVALGGALVIAHLTHGLVDHYWSRGPILQAWAAAGMASAVYFAMRPKRRRKKVMRASDFPDFSLPPPLPSGNLPR